MPRKDLLGTSTANDFYVKLYITATISQRWKATRMNMDAEAYENGV